MENNGGVALAGIEVFSDLGPPQREQIAKYCRFRRYQPDETIVSHQDRSRDVYFLVSGRVRVTIYSSCGKEVTFRDMGSGEMFGELAAIDGNPRSAHIIAMAPASVAAMNESRFHEVLENYPVVASKTLRTLAGLVRSLSERVVEYRTLSVKSRVRNELLRRARQAVATKGSPTLTPAPTHRDIANRVNTHREAVTRELSYLVREGIIVKHDNVMEITDLDRLEQLLDDAISEPWHAAMAAKSV